MNNQKSFCEMMKDYVAENERILNDWRKKYVEENQSLYPTCPNLGEYFAPDGIMFKGDFRCDYWEEENGNKRFRRWMRKPSGEENPLWANAPLRLLFLTKDQNTGEDNPAWDVRSETFRYLSEKYKPEELWIDSSPGLFFKKLVHTLYGILKTTAGQPMDNNGFTDKDALSFADDQIFARINCKKEVGGGDCKPAVLKKALDCDWNKKFLKQQILNLDADIFVCCGLMSFMPNLLNDIGYHFEPQDDDKWIYYDTEENRLAINSYHPSYSGFDYNDLIIAYSKFLKNHPDFTKSHRK